MAAGPSQDGGAGTPFEEDPEIVTLVQRVANARDAEAFAELYDRYLDRVYRYIFVRIRSREDAEDLTEQVFLQAWSALPRFRWQGKPLQAWFYTIAQNALMDHYRRARPTTSLDDESRPLHLAADGSNREIAQWLDADQLARAISELSPEQHQLIVYRFLDGHDTAQVAKLMEQRESSIRSLQYQALQKLRRLLERDALQGVA
jgi:RNA polymerase sigma-70 factor (ECF subfamily)